MNRVLFFIFSVLAVPFFSQVGPRTWQDHLSVNSCNTVAKKGTKIYGSYSNGIIKFDQKELSPQTLNKIHGLNDIGVRLLRTNSYNNKLLVIYDNCNIDILDQNDNLANYPDFKLKSLNGKKIVNEVTFNKQDAYLACGFGIIVFDTDKLEIKNTYVIGPNASSLEVFQVALNDSMIFAATPDGIYKANFKTSILNNYKSWKLDTIDLPAGYYVGITNVSGTVITCYTPSKLSQDDNGKDTIYMLNNSNKWEKYPPLAGQGHTILKLGATFENLFSIVDPIGVIVRRIEDGSTVTYVNSYNGIVDYGRIRDVNIGRDHTGNLSYWIANNRFGLYQTYGYFPYFPQNKISRNGMNRSTLGNIDIFKGKVAVSPSFIDNAGIGNYSREGINTLENNEWTYFPCNDANGNTIIDVTSVLLDRIDNTVTWAASWYLGVMKYKSGKLVATYTASNTTMPEINKNEPRCIALTMDKDGNLWFANSDQKDFLNVIKRDGKHQNFVFDKSHGFIRRAMVDRNNYVWITHERDGGLSVYKNNNFAQPVLDVNYRWLNNAVGTGNLESNTVYSVAEDKDGKIWVGTAAGIRVFYNPTSIFSGSDYDAQPIKIVQDGNVELLLGREAVTAIAVDGANNKWVGTALGGMYCFSPDGLTQLYHFTKENSALYSNSILDLNYDEATGDVYVGTDAGLQSFRSTIVAGEEEYKNVYAYPNPVKPNYQGTVLVRGLIDNSVVKIVDESGNMVWETKSNGGQVEWPVKTFAGNRVTSGVYVIYASTTDGEFKAVSKVLVVN
jgi:hypothetical protein